MDVSRMDTDYCVVMHRVKQRSRLKGPLNDEYRSLLMLAQMAHV